MATVFAAANEDTDNGNVSRKTETKHNRERLRKND